jgi:hypothetical protein
MYIKNNFNLLLQVNGFFGMAIYPQVQRKTHVSFLVIQELDPLDSNLK